jgi:hypothetical protein
MGVALGRAVVRQAQGLHAPAQGEVAARDLRLRHGADPQQRSDRLQVGREVVVAELRAKDIVPITDHGPGRLEGQRMVDCGGATHQLAGGDDGRDGRDLLAEDLEHREFRVEDARHHEPLALEELGGLDEVTLLEDQDPLVGLRREFRGHERPAGPGAHHDHIGLQDKAIGAAYDPGGLEAFAQRAVGHDAAPQNTHVLVGLPGHVERGGVHEIRVGLCWIQQPRTRIAHDLPGHLLVGVDGGRPDELRPAEDVAERRDAAVAQEEEVAVRIVGVETPELQASGKTIAIGEGAGERGQNVDEVDQELHVAQELVAVGPGELRVGGDRVVVRILLLESPPDLRIGRIEAVDDLGDDFLLDGVEDRSRVAPTQALDPSPHRPAAQGRGHQKRRARCPGETDHELPPAHGPAQVGVEGLLRAHRPAPSAPGRANRCVLTTCPLTVWPTRT